MCAARSPIVNALFKRNVITSATATSKNGHRLQKYRYLSIDTGGEAVTRLINPNNSNRTVSDFQELYEATRKKFQCKPSTSELYHVDQVEVLLIPNLYSLW